MAEGLQRRIEYSDLKFISSFAMEKILDFQTWEEPGEHARGNFRLLLSENGTDINSMNAPIQLLGQGNTAGALFSGYHGTVFRRSIQSLCEWQCGHAWHENRSGGNGISGV